MLGRAIAGIGAAYPYVIVDCPPSLGLLTLNALAAANRLIVPVQCEYYALEGLTQLLESVELIRARINPELALTGLLLTMHDGRTRLSSDVAAEVRSHFGDKVFSAVVPRSVRLAEAPSHGLPITTLRPALARRRRVLSGGHGGGRAWLASPEAAGRRGGWGAGCSRSSTPIPHGPAWSTWPLDRITANPRQPRTAFEAEALEGLARSIAADGVLQPIVVRDLGDGTYELIAGERRLRAARHAGLASVPALVRRADDRESLLLALVENVAREDLNAVDEARGYAALVDAFGLSVSEVAARVGRSRADRREHAAAARPARRRARARRRRAAQRGPRPGAADGGRARDAPRAGPPGGGGRAGRCGALEAAARETAEPRSSQAAAAVGRPLARRRPAQRPDRRAVPRAGHHVVGSGRTATAVRIELRLRSPEDAAALLERLAQAAAIPPT